MGGCLVEAEAKRRGDRVEVVTEMPSPTRDERKLGGEIILRDEEADMVGTVGRKGGCTWRSFHQDPSFSGIL
jgi:hypothetical protein